MLVVEGQTEQAFVSALLAQHLGAGSVFTPLPRCVETGRRQGRIHRGGMTTFARVRNDLIRWMKEDQNSDACFSTMFDLYRLPPDFPGYDEAARLADPYARVALLEKRFAEAIGHSRFVPYIQLHEFEALLFADPAKFLGRFPDKDREVQALTAIAGEFQSPEHIDDGKETAPSKRILTVLPAYDKVGSGPAIATSIGLAAIRAKCPHFNEWVCKLEKLGGAPADGNMP